MTHVDWHPYPEEKPELWSIKLVTFIDCGRPQISIEILVPNGNEEVWGPPGFPLEVIAWADMPEPYQPEVNND